MFEPREQGALSAPRSKDPLSRSVSVHTLGVCCSQREIRYETNTGLHDKTDTTMLLEQSEEHAHPLSTSQPSLKQCG